jgi:hypothetical protein
MKYTNVFPGNKHGAETPVLNWHPGNLWILNHDKLTNELECLIEEIIVETDSKLKAINGEPPGS